ncbi:MAG: hypothetical protein KF682_22420, partial [Nitrospira sp.]|nr:hypothetical protein [Nitrospira sp.]
MIMRTTLKGGQPVVLHSILTSITFSLLLLITTIGDLTGCSFLSSDRMVYNQAGIHIGLEGDPTIARSHQLVLNNHPLDLTPHEIESLLQPIQLIGYSGTFSGLITKPQPAPLFTPQELSTISKHLAHALREAKPDERVSFSLPKPGVTYSEERTVGSLFFRGPYLHVVVNDHSSIIRTDTGGGDYKDIRDTKGMQLGIVGADQAAAVPPIEEPRWAPFDRVHISLVVKELSARKGTTSSARTKQGRTDSPVSLPTATSPERPQGSTSPEEL